MLAAGFEMLVEGCQLISYLGQLGSNIPGLSERSGCIRRSTT